MTHNQIDYAKHKENVRHNKRSERQTDKSIAENIRHNKQTERLGQENVDLGYANVGLGYSNLRELYRHNTQMELVSQGQLEESERHNTATEEIQENANIAKVASNPSGYVVYQATKYIPKLVKGAAKGFMNLVDAKQQQVNNPAYWRTGSSSQK